MHLSMFLNHQTDLGMQNHFVWMGGIFWVQKVGSGKQSRTRLVFILPYIEQRSCSRAVKFFWIQRGTRLLFIFALYWTWIVFRDSQQLFHPTRPVWIYTKRTLPKTTSFSQETPKVRFSSKITWFTINFYLNYHRGLIFFFYTSSPTSHTPFSCILMVDLGVLTNPRSENH